MKISIVTPSQESRYESLLLLKEMIKEQTLYSKIDEWCLIDGTKNHPGKFDLDRLQTDFKPKIRMVAWEKDCNIGKLRNKVNNSAIGDIIICMDDDDYYPNLMVESVINLFLKNPDKLICGCTDTYMYDLFISKQFKFDTFGPKHAINSTMSFRKEYLKNHKHDENVSFGEELSFTDNFTVDIIQIAPELTVNTICHHTNTYNKRLIVTQYYNGGHGKVKEIDKNMIPKKYLKEMKKLYLTEKQSKYDIVYFGGNSVKWSATDKSIGGSEQALQYLSESWVKKGHKVAVYTTVSSNYNHNGVDYYNWMDFPYYSHFKNLIIWRLNGLSCIFYAKLTADKIYFDLHDNFMPQSKNLYNKFLEKNKFDKIFVKSNYHKLEFEQHHNIQLKDDQYAIICNGLRVEEFKKYENKFNRDKYRFCYCSCYTRGLENILKHVWPQIVAIEPKAELHIYYGMDLVSSQEFRMKILELIAITPNVMNHNKQPLDIIAREKYISSFHLYTTDSPAEIDCISIRESVLCGCIPLISKTNVFVDRDGIQFDVDIKGTNSLIEVGRYIGNLINDQNKIDHIRNSLKESKLIMDWDSIADQWIEVFNQKTENTSLSVD